MTRQFQMGNTYVFDNEDRDFMLPNGYLSLPFPKPAAEIPILAAEPLQSIEIISTVGEGIWYKPLREEFSGAPVRIIVFGAGGGGGGGTTAAAATAISGGSGGGGGARMEFTTTWDYIGLQEHYVIAAGGAGGAVNANGQASGLTEIGGQYMMYNIPNAPVGVPQWDQVPWRKRMTTLNPNDVSNSRVQITSDNKYCQMWGFGYTINWARSTQKMNTTDTTRVFIEYQVIQKGTNPITGGFEDFAVGIADGTPVLGVGLDKNSFGMIASGHVRAGNTLMTVAGGPQAINNGEVIGMVYDADRQRVWFRLGMGYWNLNASCDPSNVDDPFYIDLEGLFYPTNWDHYAIVSGGNSSYIDVNFGGFGLPQIIADSGGGGEKGSTAASGGGGGSGGAAGQNGNAGVAGAAGLAGGAAGGLGGNGGSNGTWLGGAGGGGGSVGNAGPKGGLAYGGGPGGGAGGGKSATPAYFAGGPGGENESGVSVKAGTPITDPGTGFLYGWKPGQNGIRGKLGQAGTGGSGGASAASAAGKGGTGGYPAAGGGGGGSTITGQTAGAGGQGGNGQIIFIIGYETGRR